MKKAMFKLVAVALIAVGFIVAAAVVVSGPILGLDLAAATTLVVGGAVLWGVASQIALLRSLRGDLRRLRQVRQAETPPWLRETLAAGAPPAAEEDSDQPMDTAEAEWPEPSADRWPLGMPEPEAPEPQVAHTEAAEPQAADVSEPEAEGREAGPEQTEPDELFAPEPAEAPEPEPERNVVAALHEPADADVAPETEAEPEPEPAAEPEHEAVFAAPEEPREELKEPAETVAAPLDQPQEPAEPEVEHAAAAEEPGLATPEELEEPETPALAPAAEAQEDTTSPPPAAAEPEHQPALPRTAAELAQAEDSAQSDEDLADDGVELYVVEERMFRGRPARVLSDGTIEAETDEGWMRFEDFDHLREYTDAMAGSRAAR